jgi:hypothetical protein
MPIGPGKVIEVVLDVADASQQSRCQVADGNVQAVAAAFVGERELHGAIIRKSGTLCIKRSARS